MFNIPGEGQLTTSRCQTDQNECYLESFAESSKARALFPNPVRSGQVLSLKTQEPVQSLSMTGTAGQKISLKVAATGKEGDATVKIPQGLARGLYKVQVVTKSRVLNYSLIIE